MLQLCLLSLKAHVYIYLSKEFAPVPAADEPGVNVVWADWSSPHRAELAVFPSIRGCEGGHVNGVADGLVARGVNHIPQRLFGILNASSFGVTVAQENQLLLLPRPQPTHTLSVHLWRAEKKRDEDLTIQACDESETTRQKKKKC